MDHRLGVLQDTVVDDACGCGRLDWSALAGHGVLPLIARHLPAVVDRIAVSRVCRSWRRAIISDVPRPAAADDDDHNLQLRRRYGLPCLVYAHAKLSFRLVDPIHNDNRHTFEEVAGLINMGSSAAAGRAPPPPPSYAKILFSRDGWLLLMSSPPRAARTNLQDDDDQEENTLYCDMFFLNLLSKSKIELPTLKTNYANSQFSFSDRPSLPSSCVVVAFLDLMGYYMSVGVCRPGDAQWTMVETRHDRPFQGCVTNIVWSSSSGRFYCLDLYGALGGFDPTRQSWEFVERQKDLGRRVNRQSEQYLVESGAAGELLRVCHMGSSGVVVYKFVDDAPTGRWVPVRDLGDMALFVGRQNSMSVVAPPVESMRGKVYFNAVVVDPRGGGDAVVGCSIIDPISEGPVQEEEEKKASKRCSYYNNVSAPPPASASRIWKKFPFSAWVDLQY